jgi:membrane protease YdiL (CAAX protease family)
LVCAFETTPVAVLVAVTAALGIRAPDESATVPSTLAFIWANIGHASPRISAAVAAHADKNLVIKLPSDISDFKNCDPWSKII